MTTDVGQENKEFSVTKEIFDWIEAIIIALVCVIIIMTLVFKIIGVKGISMVDTLHENDRVIISPLFYTPAQGDIVVISEPGFKEEPIIKRIIAVGGQTVDIDYDADKVYVDGVALDEPYINESDMRPLGDLVLPAEVPEGHVFVMGDNRNRSADSRDSAVGMVDERNILGRAVLRIYPFNAFGTLGHG